MADAKQAKKDLAEANKAGVIPSSKAFYTCGSCRWSSTGEGCCYCNPEKNKALVEIKLRESRALQHAVEAAKTNALKAGLKLRDTEAEVKPKDPALQGGGLARVSK